LAAARQLWDSIDLEPQKVEVADPYPNKWCEPPWIITPEIDQAKSQKVPDPYIQSPGDTCECKAMLARLTPPPVG